MEDRISPYHINIWYVVLAVVAALLLHDGWLARRDVRTVPYSEFETLLEHGSLSEVDLQGDTTIRARLKKPAQGARYIETVKMDPTFAAKLQKAGVRYQAEPENTFFRNILLWTLPVLIMIGVWLFIAKRFSARLQGGVMAIGKSKAKIYVESDTKVKFSDVAGIDEAKAELQEIVDFLKNPNKFHRLGGRMPKGVLLVGPPGTGKTLIAKAVAGEAEVPFFSTNGAEFVEMFVGVGAARVRDLFEQAKRRAPCIIFIDELDALGRARLVAVGPGVNDEKEQTLNQLLAELDGFDSASGIILLAATNRPEIIDPALLRSGRFDRQVVIDRPDKAGRLAILELHSKKIKMAPHLDLSHVAALTPGLTGADLANIVNEAALIAVRRESDSVNEGDFTEAVERLTAGLEKKGRLISPFEKKIVAYHEIGHVIAAIATGNIEQIHKVSIIPRGVGAIGYTMQRPSEERFLMTDDELKKKMIVLLGGRAAEQLEFGHFSTGAADDIDKATDIAWNAVTKYGMSASVGNIVYDTRRPTFLGYEQTPFQTRTYSDETANKIDAAVADMVATAMQRASEILTKNKSTLEEAAKLLLKRETLTETDLKPFVAKIL